MKKTVYCFRSYDTYSKEYMTQLNSVIKLIENTARELGCTINKELNCNTYGGDYYMNGGLCAIDVTEYFETISVENLPDDVEATIRNRISEAQLDCAINGKLI